MPRREEREISARSTRPLEGLPVIRASVAGIDLGRERHWVCAPTRDRSAREIASFGATIAELLPMSEWLKTRQVVPGRQAQPLHTGDSKPNRIRPSSMFYYDRVCRRVAQ